MSHETVVPEAAPKSTFWSEETNQKRSDALKGRRKSLKHRAKIYASYKVGRDKKGTPEWEAAYQDRLYKLRMAQVLSNRDERLDIDEMMQLAEEQDG